MVKLFAGNTVRFFVETLLDCRRPCAGGTVRVLVEVRQVETMRRKVSVVSLFSGAAADGLRFEGGFALKAEISGKILFTTVFSNDINAFVI